MADAGDTAEPAVLLRGRYELLEVVGRGGEGEVLRAWDHQHDRPVALKIRPVTAGVSTDGLLDEARTLLSLRPHENVATVRDDFLDGDNYYLVLDWVAGEDLRARLRRDGAPGLPYPLVLEVLKDVASALDHLHSHTPPIVHGDVKPANIVVSTGAGGAPRAVLVDFGLSGALSDTPNTAATDAYAAPELYQGAPATPASDIYAFAATAFELITGRVPLPGATLDWSSVPPEALREVRETLARGLALAPEHRPERATALLEDLGHHGRTARRGRRLLRLVPGARRGSALRFAAALATAAIFGSGAAALFGSDDDPTPTSVTNPFPTGTLPADSERVAQVGMFYRTMLSDGTVGGIYETTEVGHDGETARTRRVTGLTSSWTHVVPLREDLLLFYRQSDEYAVVVLWTDDGQALDQYQIHPLGLEWTHIAPVGPDRFLTYDAADGRAQLAIHNGETPVGGSGLLAQLPVVGLRAGWTHLVNVADGRVLAYDATTGAGEVLGVAEDGTVTSEGVLDLGRDWLTFTVVRDGIVVLGDGAGELELVDVSEPGRVETLDELELDRSWTLTTFTSSGLVVLYDTETGESQLVDAKGEELVAETEATLPSGSIALTARA